MPGVRAVHIETGQMLSRSAPPPTTTEPETWLFEADPAAIRANALGELCSANRLTALGTSNGYLTGTGQVESPFLKPYHVLRASKPDIKALKEHLKELGADRPVVKSRVGGLDASGFAKRFHAFGDRQIAVVLYPVGRSIRALIVEPPPKDCR